MMYNTQRPSADSIKEATPQAEQVVGWLVDREEVVRTLQLSFGALPSQRDERLSHMSDVLQATAQGLGARAAAVWAGVPEHLLRTWLKDDQVFASAVEAASALATAHGVDRSSVRTPATVRVIILAISKGLSWETAVETVGLSSYKLRVLWRDSPMLAALVDAARRARLRKPKRFVPPNYRPRKPGRKVATHGYRLVRRDGS
ncbi:hypothetical protein [Streptomyces sp. 8L]|uniref:hypothetical protein n=1 Tax=Streptomyces sp. 8L TaxID=2877242 RepID=UPI001CD670F9|nr:hypothetical protein [Streptomyces sp. 8L]MCA1219432.1 hypothetical protein [Streptomyces sp. 8L]